MHARYVRVWFGAGLVALAIGGALTLAQAGGASIPRNARAVAMVTAECYLALALALGILPAHVRRDWPTPMFAWAAIALGALALPLLSNARAFAALAGASLVVGALQPLALFLSPIWSSAREANPHRSTDAAALVAIALSLLGALAGGLLLIALPRGLVNAPASVVLVACVMPATLGALLFMLPRLAGEPLRAATLAYAAAGALAIAAIALAWAFTHPLGASYRWPVAILALAYALGITTLLRAARPASVGPLLASALVLAILAALALLLATLTAAPNSLIVAALDAHLALGLVLLAAALVVGAPLLLPGRASEGRWTRLGPALLIAALFLETPALQYARSALPAAIVGAIGLAMVIVGLAPAARTVETVARRSRDR